MSESPLTRSAAADRARSGAKFRRWVVGVGGVLIVTVCGSTALDTWRGYQGAVTASQRELTHLARAMTEQTARSFHEVDAMLRDLAIWLKSPEGRGLDAEEMHQRLKQQIVGVPQVRALAIIDATGRPVHSSRADPPPPNAVLSDRSFFTAQRDNPEQALFIAEPTINGAGELSFSLSRRLQDGHGTFQGVVVAKADSAYFEQFYRAIDLGPANNISLMRADGFVLARYPAAPNIIGQPDEVLQDLFASGAAHDEYAWRLKHASDDEERIIVVRRVRDFPLAIAISRETGAALAAWRVQAVDTIARTLALSVFAGLLIWASIRQLKRREEADLQLRISEERYAMAMEGTNEGHWDWDLDSDHIFLSGRMKELYGIQGDPLFASSFELLASARIHPDDRARFEAAKAAHLAGPDPLLESEYRVLLPDGETRWLLSRGKCFRNEAGRPYRVAGSVMDITSRKRAEEEKQRLEAQLRQAQKLEAMGTLAGGIAHDFNNILGAILGYGEMAQKSTAEGTLTRRYLEYVMNAGNRAKALVERILTFSRSGMGVRAPLHVESVVSETLDLLRASLPAGVQIETRLEAGNASLIGDTTQIHQVVMNLCTNAMQAMPDGGLLSVTLDSVDLVAPQTLSNGNLPAGQYLRLTVKDTGVGIEPKVIERIFDPFFSTKDVGEGTGLGLSLVHSIVADLGGGIEVTSQPGKGTCFEIYLPVLGETALPTPAADEAAPRGGGETVLLVDDEKVLVALGEEMLAELGYEAVGFTGSVAALTAFRASPDRFDIVLSDETMPEMTGTELACEIRLLRPDVPIILMSGYSGPRLNERAAAAGVCDVLKKPLQSLEIARCLSRALHLRSQT